MLALHACWYGKIDEVICWHSLDAQDALCCALLLDSAAKWRIPLMKWSQTCVITLQKMYVGLACKVKWQNWRGNLLALSWCTGCSVLCHIVRFCCKVNDSTHEMESNLCHNTPKNVCWPCLHVEMAKWMRSFLGSTLMHSMLCIVPYCYDELPLEWFHSWKGIKLVS